MGYKFLPFPIRDYVTTRTPPFCVFPGRDKGSPLGKAPPRSTRSSIVVSASCINIALDCSFLYLCRQRSWFAPYSIKFVRMYGDQTRHSRRAGTGNELSFRPRSVSDQSVSDDEGTASSIFDREEGSAYTHRSRGGSADYHSGRNPHISDPYRSRHHRSDHASTAQGTSETKQRSSKYSSKTNFLVASFIAAFAMINWSSKRSSKKAAKDASGSSENRRAKHRKEDKQGQGSVDRRERRGSSRRRRSGDRRRRD